MTRNLLEEIIAYDPKHNQDKYAQVEATARNIIGAAINLLDSIQTEFDEHEADELIRRFYISIKTSDYTKFERKIQTLLSKSEDKNNASRVSKKP